MQQEQATILIVDDTPENIDVLRGLLKSDYRIRVAINGEQALKLAVAARPDLILLDVMMPGLDGYEVCRRLKADPETEGIPVIFVTAMNETHDEVRGFAVGGVDFINKPVVPAIVQARVQTHLKLRSAYRFIRETFGRYLSEEVVDNLIDSPEGLELGGEKRMVSILMADLRGFTSLAEQLAPEVVVDMINIFLGAMVDVIHDHQGTIDEFIGDAILAIFGAPVQRENDAGRAVRCALAMQLAMDDVNAEFERRGYPQVEMGIGINSGEVIVGNIGSSKRSKYGVVGRHVNTTSRIESYTIGGQILVSESTRSICGDLLRIAGEIKVMPKGIQKEISIFDVSGIYGEQPLLLPERNDAEMKAGVSSVPVRITLLEGKQMGESFGGRIVASGARRLELESEQPCSAFSDLKIDTGDGEVSLEVYGKVIRVDGDSQLLVHITSAPGDFLRFLIGIGAS